MASLPGRKVFFAVDPTVFTEAAIRRNSDFRDRQDADAGRPGVVGAVGECWARRRERLRFLQTRELLERIAPAAVDAAVQNAATEPGCDGSALALILPPAELLQHVTRVVRYALNEVVLGTQPPSPSTEGTDNAYAAEGGLRRQVRHELRLGMPLASLAARGRALLRVAAALSLSMEQLWCVVRRGSFFELAQLYTSRGRKVERRTARYVNALSRLRARWHVSPRAEPADWLSIEVGRRWRLSRDTPSSPPALDNDGDDRDGDAPAEESTADPPILTSSTTAEGPAYSRACCLLDALLAPHAMRRHSAADGTLGPPLSESETLEILRDVLVAGVETTSETLVGAAMLLREHPDVLARVVAEASTLHRRLARADDCGLAVAEDLPYTRACVLEAARLYPAAPLLFRVAARNTSLCGTQVPAGSGLVASTLQLGRDGRIWADANEFIPERFLVEGGRRDAGSSRAYLPFGTGPRSCIGQQLALTISTIALASMVID